MNQRIEILRIKLVEQFTPEDWRYLLDHDLELYHLRLRETYEPSATVKLVDQSEIVQDKPPAPVVQQVSDSDWDEDDFDEEEQEKFEDEMDQKTDEQLKKELEEIKARNPEAYKRHMRQYGSLLYSVGRVMKYRLGQRDDKIEALQKQVDDLRGSVASAQVVAEIQQRLQAVEAFQETEATRIDNIAMARNINSRRLQ